MIHRLSTNCRRKLFHLWAKLATDATINEVIPLNRAELCESLFFHAFKVVWMCSWMIHSLPTKWRQKLVHFCARLHTDATINEIIPLNRVELCESVVFLHSQIVLTMLMYDSQTIDELPTKIISFVGEAGHRRNHKWSNSSESRRIVRKCSFLIQSNYSDYAHELFTDCQRKLFHLWARLDIDATINEVTPLNRAELCESVVFLHSRRILTMLMNDSQTADESLAKIISFVGEAGHRRNHKWSNSSESRRIVRKCTFFTHSK